MFLLDIYTDISMGIGIVVGLIIASLGIKSIIEDCERDYKNWKRYNKDD